MTAVTRAAALRPNIGTRRRRAETHPLRTGRQLRRLARDPVLAHAERDLLARVDARIAPRDGMYVGNAAHYFSVGLSATRSIDAALPSAPGRILDMPCGHGRVLRFLRARFPDESVVACDLDSDGVAFCAERFRAEPVVSSPDLASV